MPLPNQRLALVLAGEAGQGLQAIEAILTRLLKRQGFHVFATKEYMSRVRGGSNSVTIVVSDSPHPAPVELADIALPLGKAALEHIADRLGPDSLVIGDAAALGRPDAIDIPFQTLAASMGGALMANTLAAGVAAGLLGAEAEAGADYVEEHFASKPAELRAKNRAVFLEGHRRGQGLRDRVQVNIPRDPAQAGRIMLTGHEAVALGAVAGGVTYAVAYPMSPGTAVLEEVASLSKRFDILVEQVEDEVGVVNMALGAWFAGARTLVTTSGGGFALMVEGVSLSGMAEIPLVVHLAQRPGPATGLPTRTEQGDLFLAAFAGHGEFARLVLAPGDLDEAFALSQAAFEFADRFQVPVFLLTDQYLLDSYYATDPFDPAAVAARTDALAGRAALPGDSPVHPTKHDGPLAPAGFPRSRDPESSQWITQTGPDYCRALLTADGLSPRGIPGYGRGLVAADSDEHDETGHITENLRLRDDMVRKRQAKTELLRSAIPLPAWDGPDHPDLLVVGWGSTKQAIALAVERLRTEQPGLSIARAHFSWVQPFAAGTEALLKRAKRIVLVENNTDGQLGKLLRMDLGIKADRTILRHDGLPFTADGLAASLRAAAAILTEDQK